MVQSGTTQQQAELWRRSLSSRGAPNQQIAMRIVIRNIAEPKIRVKNLSRFAANGNMLLSAVSLNIKAGIVHGLIGPSGSGKSTVLRALNRLWEPPAGSVLLDGKDITKLDVFSLRRRVGMVFQAPCLFPGTVADNVRYGPSLQGTILSNDEIEELLQRAGITEPTKTFGQKPVDDLSGGEAQRVSLARTLANQPEVLLLDEPTSSLDPLSTRLVENSLVELQSRQGFTVVLVSHNMEQVERLCGQATVLHQGSVLETGSLDELKHHHNPFLKQFFTGEL